MGTQGHGSEDEVAGCKTPVDRRGRAVAARRESDALEAALRDAAAALQQGLVVLDEAARIVFCNDRYAALGGLDPDHALLARGAPWADLLRHLALRGDFDGETPEAAVEKRLTPILERALYESDRALPGRRVLHTEGKPLPGGGYVLTFTDVTDRIRERERLDRLVRERSDALDRANKALMDSLRYASMIQTGTLPDHTALAGTLGEHFAFYLPAETVGGDFYFSVRTEHGTFVGLGDCTGQGVPGAMMTMLAVSLCRRTVKELGAEGPAAVLDKVDLIARGTLHRQAESAVGGDTGFELALCRIDGARGRIQFAGAGLDLFAQTGGRMERVRGLVDGLGYSRRAKKLDRIPEVTLTPADAQRLFLTSDGILDQSGGPKGYGFGRRRLVEALARGCDWALPAQGQGLVDSLSAYQAQHPQRDDLTILGFAADAALACDREAGAAAE
jgi:serine phosphatase RsbU (regulator of sigma subunit)